MSGMEKLVKTDMHDIYKSFGALITSFVSQIDPLRDSVKAVEQQWSKSVPPLKKELSDIKEELAQRNEENSQMREQLAVVTQKLAGIMAEQLAKEKAMQMTVEGLKTEKEKLLQQMSDAQKRADHELANEQARTRVAQELTSSVRAQLESEIKAKKRLELQVSKEDETLEKYKQELLKMIQEKNKWQQAAETAQAQHQVLKDQQDSDHEALFQLQEEYKHQRLLNMQLLSQAQDLEASNQRLVADALAKEETDKHPDRKRCIRCRVSYLPVDNPTDACRYHGGKLEQHCHECGRWTAAEGKVVCKTDVSGVCWYDRARWTCCHSEDKFSVGCATGRHIVQYGSTDGVRTSPATPSSPLANLSNARSPVQPLQFQQRSP
eukprot:TRINITY_DN2357_c0_g2_i1.p1 TRINITY_DN2357_c0_g2~~TRINITY_DN2357_c0_g2_i1.p1  ORF type:complete len:378 (-),score=87.98 TRINITY_DN2357_c0_g2_i1:166-1299(-)